MRLALLLTACLTVGLPAWAGDAVPASPELILAGHYQEGLDVSRYWVSEKLDGARAYWDGQHLYFRSGRPVHAPAWFTAGFPVHPLDGELWIGRGQFDRLSGIVRREQPRDEEWRQVRYMVFELPNGSGGFSERLARLRESVAAAGLPWLQVVEQFRVVDSRALEQRLDAVLAAGGEGLMLHRADAPYLTGRGDALLKMKPWLDAEATVIAHLPGKGRLAGMLGALVVETPAGQRFHLGTGFTDAQRRDPPPPGAVVTYRYRELNPSGLPRFASFLRVRPTF